MDTIFVKSKNSKNSTFYSNSILIDYYLMFQKNKLKKK